LNGELGLPRRGFERGLPLSIETARHCNTIIVEVVKKDIVIKRTLLSVLASCFTTNAKDTIANGEASKTALLTPTPDVIEYTKLESTITKNIIAEVSDLEAPKLFPSIINDFRNQDTNVNIVTERKATSPGFTPGVEGAIKT
jgi:hypothetical protein